MKGVFKAKDETIEQVLFSSNSRFKIPRYQRQYTWEDDEIDDFWRDLLGSSSEDRLFIGSLILRISGKKELKDRPDELNEYIRKIYKVLLSRGIKGCYVYFQDNGVKRYFEERLDAIN